MIYQQLDPALIILPRCNVGCVAWSIALSPFIISTFYKEDHRVFKELIQI